MTELFSSLTVCGEIEVAGQGYVEITGRKRAAHSCGYKRLIESSILATYFHTFLIMLRLRIWQSALHLLLP